MKCGNAKSKTGLSSLRIRKDKQQRPRHIYQTKKAISFTKLCLITHFRARRRPVLRYLKFPISIEFECYFSAGYYLSALQDLQHMCRFTQRLWHQRYQLCRLIIFVYLMNRIDVISLDPGERREWNGGNSTSQRGVKFPVDNESKVWYHLPFFRKRNCFVNQAAYFTRYFDRFLQPRVGES